MSLVPNATQWDIDEGRRKAALDARTPEQVAKDDAAALARIKNWEAYLEQIALKRKVLEQHGRNCDGLTDVKINSYYDQLNARQRSDALKGGVSHIDLGLLKPSPDLLEFSRESELKGLFS